MKTSLLRRAALLVLGIAGILTVPQKQGEALAGAWEREPQKLTANVPCNPANQFDPQLSGVYLALGVSGVATVGVGVDGTLPALAGFVVSTTSGDGYSTGNQLLSPGTNEIFLPLFNSQNQVVGEIKICTGWQIEQGQSIRVRAVVDGQLIIPNPNSNACPHSLLEACVQRFFKQ